MHDHRPRRRVRSSWWGLALLLALPVLAWSQAQLINGNRTHAGATNYGPTTGSGTAYVLTLNAAIPGYVDGSCYLLRIHTPNTGDATLNVNGKGALPMRKFVSGVAVALAVGDFIAGQDVEVCYDAATGPRFQVMSLGGSGGAGGLAVSEVDGSPSGTFTGLKFSNGSMTNNGDGTATIVTGAGGGGDASTNTATSVDSEVALFSGTGGKTLKRATVSGVLFGTAGVLSAAVPGTHYAGLASTNVYTGRQDASGAASTAANKTGTTLPATCVVGDTFFKSNDPAGRNIYGCTVANIWTLQGDGTGAAGTVSISGTPSTGQAAEWTSSSAIAGVATTGTGLYVKAQQPTLTVMDSTFTIGDNIDPTKQAQFMVGGLTSGSPRTFTFPDFSSTLAVTAQTLGVFAPTTSLQLSTVLTDETGAGLAVFNQGPSLINANLGTPSAINLANAQGLPLGTAGAVTGTLACAQHPALTGAITTPPNSCATTLAANSVGLTNLVDIATASFLGRQTAGTGDPEVLSATQTKTVLSLDQVTNDAQLKRSANDFSTFPVKAAPVSGDLLLIEDSAAAGAKKQISIGSLPGGGGGGSGITGGTANGAMYATGATTASSTGALSDGQLMLGRSGLPPVAAGLTGTTNQIRVTPGPGTVTFDFPPGGVTLPATTTGTFSGPLAGNATTATGLSAVLGCAQHPALTGAVTTTAGSCATTIPAGTITYSLLQNTSVASVLLGRGSASAGVPQEITLGTGLTMAGTVLNAAAGTVTNTGTPVANQVAVWTTATQLQGTAPLTYSAGTLAVGTAGTLGKVTVAGNTSGVVTLQPQAAAGTYNFNLPTTAGTTGQVLTSAGGVAAPMTWTTLAPSATTDTTNATNITTGTLPAGVIGAGTITYAKLQNTGGASILLGRGATTPGVPQEITLGTGLAMTGTVLSSTTSGGDITSVGDCLTGACNTVGGLRINPRIVPAGPGSPITPNADTTDQVVVTALTGATTINAPSPFTVQDGQWLLFSFYTATSQTLTWNAIYSAENGLALPTKTYAGAYLIVEFRYSTTSSKWALARMSRDDYQPYPLTDAATIGSADGAGILNCDKIKLGYLTTLSQASTFPNPTCTPRHGQLLRFSITSATSQPLNWGTQYQASFGIPLPTATTPGGNVKDQFAFQYDELNTKWDMIASTQVSRTAARRTCMMVMGDEGGSILTDADLTGKKEMCLLAAQALIEEVTVKADAGTPTVSVHTRLGTTDTTLLSSPLAAGAANAVTCARATAQVGITAGTTCVGTLINTTAQAGAWIGLTSGVAGGTAKRFSIAVTYSYTQ
jgi:uncharacterized protein DUF5907